MAEKRKSIWYQTRQPMFWNKLYRRAKNFRSRTSKTDYLFFVYLNVWSDQNTLLINKKDVARQMMMHKQWLLKIYCISFV